MRKNIKILLFSLIGSVVVAGVAVGAIVGVRNANNNSNTSVNDTNNQNNVFARQDLIEGKINYLAFGDSLTAGFNSQLSEDFPGELVSGGEITGLSYPSYVAQYLQTITNNRLNSYRNFGISGSTLSGWNSLFTIPNSEIRGQLGEPGKANAFIEQFLNRVKEANLITVTLGANDFLGDLANSPLLSQLLSGQGDLDSSQMREEVQKITSSIVQKVRILVNSIKSLNSNVRINFVSYPQPFFRLREVISSFLAPPGSNSSDNNPIQRFLSVLNNTIQKTVESLTDSKVNFLNAFDRTWWVENSNLVAKGLFDIHPTEIGYKKIAQDIVLKLITNREDEKIDLSSTKNTNLNVTWDQSFYNSDLKTVGQQIAIENSTLKEQYQKILNLPNSTNPSVAVAEERINGFKGEFSFENFANRIFAANSPIPAVRSIFNFATQALLEILNRGVENEADKVTFNSAPLINNLIKNNVLTNILVKVQSTIDNAITSPSQVISRADFISALQSTLLDPKISLSILKSIFAAESKTFDDAKFRKAIANFASQYFLDNLALIKGIIMQQAQATSQAIPNTTLFFEALEDPTKLEANKAAISNIIDFTLRNLGPAVNEGNSLIDILTSFLTTNLSIVVATLDTILPGKIGDILLEIAGLFGFSLNN